MELFDKYDLHGLTLKNRVVMAPMTRSRATQPGDVPNEMMAEYYAQRAGAGLIITEASQISPQGKGYSFTPGIYTQEQVEGWKLVTEAVHKAGGRIFLQLWHVGRMSHASLHTDGKTVGPSAIAPNATVWISLDGKEGQMLECPVPQELKLSEIKRIVSDYVSAAENAKAAGFDGIEIHAGNGYLLDEFLRSSSNHRTDEYGGSITNRIRLLLEICEAVSGVYDSEHVGIRLSPHNTARGMDCPEVIDAVYTLAAKLSEMDLGYIHFAEADWDNAPDVPLEFRKKIREIYQGQIIVAGKYDLSRANTIVSEGLADLVAFGRGFISNPDLVERMEQNLPLAPFDDTTLFGGGRHGLTDYPKYRQ